MQELYVVKHYIDTDHAEITNDVEKWLERNNRNRLDDDLEEESLNEFEITEHECVLFY